MNLYMNHRFIREFSFYLSNYKVHFGEEECAELSAFQKECFVMEESFAEKHDVQIVEQLIEYIEASDYANQRRIKAFKMLKDKVLCISVDDIYNLYAILFEISNYNEVSFPAYDILLNHYAEIIVDIASSKESPLIMKTDRDILQFKQILYKHLAKYICKFCSPADLFFIDNTVVYEVDEEFNEEEKLLCNICTVDKEVFNRIRNVKYLVGYESQDIDAANMFIGNLITFINEDQTDAITFQIIGQISYSSFGTMLDSLGTACFGYSDKTLTEFVEIVERYIRKYNPEGACALCVNKLKRAINNENDFRKLQETGDFDFYQTGIDVLNETNWDTFFKLTCCGIEVGNWYKYCPKCGKKIDIINTPKGKTLPNTGLFELFDYATWNCSCGKGFERYGYDYCPICGKKQ